MYFSVYKFDEQKLIKTTNVECMLSEACNTNNANCSLFCVCDERVPSLVVK